MTMPFIMVAPTGAQRTTADHPALPIELDEIIQTARACHTAGADALHLHVRDHDGLHSLDAGRYVEALTELATILPKLPVQITTEAAGLFDVPAQIACLRSVKPKWASISVREIDRSPELADTLYGLCADNGTNVQHILYGPDDVALLAQPSGRGDRASGPNRRNLRLGQLHNGPNVQSIRFAGVLGCIPIPSALDDLRLWSKRTPLFV